ncbi:hypothetical protein RND81_03G196600 [Saponaria officinalis]|uniref:EF-hand domain-containing protein n=1 Tax=Saponaria officinalis TaxID=3572 RepID=A0AAW1M7K7_SAPOF
MSKSEQQEQHYNSNDSESNDDDSISEEGSKTLEIESSATTTDYEKQRQARITANKARMDALGLRNIANSLMGTPQNSRKTRNSTLKSKKVEDDDDEYEPNNGDNEDDQLSSSGDDEEFEEEEETFVRRNRKSSAKKVKNMKLKSNKQVCEVSMSNQTDNSVYMDEDEALKQAIALSLNDVGEISDLQHGGLSRKSSARTASCKEKSRDQIREDNTRSRKRKLFTSRVQMTEDDLVIHFCQIDEVGKGSITLRDVERMAATHDFTWTDKELSDMIRCFDNDRDGKLTLDDFRNIAQRCNMLQVQENF